jgi:hypothetical protein
VPREADTNSRSDSEKSKIGGVVGIVITAIVGFIFGIGANQVTDFVKRADDCLDGLSHYLAGVEADITSKPDALTNLSGPITQIKLPPLDQPHAEGPPTVQPPASVLPPPVPPRPEQLNDALLKFDADIVMPRINVRNKCPMRGESTEYLNINDVNNWNDTFERLRKYCFGAAECSDAAASESLKALADSTYKLIVQANEVSQWGLVRRAKYEVMHLY